MRPKTIVAFEWLYLFTLVLGLFQATVMWDEITVTTSPAMVLTIQGITLAVVLALVLWVSRGRSNVAKWINVALFLLGLPGIVILYSGGLLLGWHVISALQTLLQALALSLLFTPSARDWLGRRNGSRDDLKNTFE